MNKNTICLIGIIALLSSALHAHDHSMSQSTQMEQKMHGYREIHTQELKDLLHSNPSVIVVDTRTDQYDDGKRILGAKFIPYDSSEEIIMAALPNKDATIVVYCTNAQCAASKFMAEQLVKMGYNHVLKYSEGIQEWEAKSNPIETLR